MKSVQDREITVLLNLEISTVVDIHAMKHIIGNDFDKEDADNIEYNAHNMEVAMELCV